jgi:hypothetical protein
MEGSVRYLNLRFGPRLCLDGLSKTSHILSQYSWSPGRGLNPRPTEYEVGKIAADP